jgi:hypothetical protein
MGAFFENTTQKSELVIIAVKSISGYFLSGNYLKILLFFV